MGKITREEAKELGLPTQQGQVYSLNKKTGEIKLISSQEEAYKHGFPVDEGQRYKFNRRTGEVIKLNSKGGAVKKYSHGGSVSGGHQLTYKRK